MDIDVITRLVVPRFLAYTRYWTTSDRAREETPSTAGQWDLARALVSELENMGVPHVVLTDRCYVVARLPARGGAENCPALGFMAHLDTAEDVSGKEVKAALVPSYNGERIELPGGGALDPALDTDLARQAGKAIIHADGATLLGADDKAGIAEIMTAAEYLITHPEIGHGPVEIIFTPDEETGKGLPGFPQEEVTAQVCYTLDGGALGEVEAECFNAYKADIRCTGKVTHLGYARGVMANAALMAASFALMLPRSESPEATDGYYGYYCPINIEGTVENASLECYIRDFDRAGAERRIAALERFARAVEAQFPGGQVTVAATPQYYNMKENIQKRPEAMDTLKRALSNLGIPCHLRPIRGGTDGSRLTEMGIPTPNIFTGGRNWHSRTEWASVPEMAAACAVIIELVRLWAQEQKA
ncbi:MAG: peptidase T [Spirochaetaceae bacterium]|jgi:tripeptide aminopeptidase|nr:peptidase T [Spirochaetaceae bacterium]